MSMQAMNRNDDLRPDPDEEDLVQRLMADGIDAQLDSADPRLARVRAMALELDRQGALERGAGSAPATDPRLMALEARVEVLASEELASRASSSRRVEFRSWSYGLAALLILGVGLWLAVPPSDLPRDVEPNEPFRLNSGGGGSLSFRSSPGGSLELTWQASPRRDSVYEVTVYDRAPATGGVVLARSDSLDVARWDPAEDHMPNEAPVTRWPTTVWIEVSTESPSGGVRDLVSEALSR